MYAGSSGIQWRSWVVWAMGQEGQLTVPWELWALPRRACLALGGAICQRGVRLSIWCEGTQKRHGEDQVVCTKPERACEKEEMSREGRDWAGERRSVQERWERAPCSSPWRRGDLVVGSCRPVPLGILPV